MKTIYTSLFLVFLTIGLNAQTPEGIVYQAEARDNLGNIIANETLDVKIKILENDYYGIIVWEGLHDVTTNKYGMFVIVIGTGESTLGYRFEDIKWGERNHFLNVQVKKSESTDWLNMGTNQFLSVPYAFHAKTASYLVNESNSFLKSAEVDLPSQVWSLFGNSKTNPQKDKFGTTDDADLVFVTNNLERLRITSDGQLITPDGIGLDIGGNLSVRGDMTSIDKDLYVGRNVFLNTDDGFVPHGETYNYGNFTVANMSSTFLTGILTVDKKTYLKNLLEVDDKVDFNSSLNVNNQSPTYLSGTLTVDYNTALKSTLNVDGDALLKSNLNVTNNITSKSLLVKDNVNNGNFLATFENTNTSEGDGIRIKLGKKATKNHSSSETIDNALKVFLGEGFGPDDFNSVKKLLDGDLDPTDLAYLALLQVPTLDDLKAIGATVCNLTESIGGSIIDFLNTELHLPAAIGPYGVDLGELGEFDVVPRITVVPKIPGLDLPCEELGEGFQFPELVLSDIYVSNPLDNNNSFIQFTDNTNWQMGEIKAQSIENWAVQYLDPIFLYRLYSIFKGLDKSKIFPEIKVLAKEIAESYLQIGVEYSSGNGDYAEWLERLNHDELITAGDIVAVKSGKITKDLKYAEQVMAISSNPIVLGNIPENNKEHLGNNVAFMGQIPVKIMGPVVSGDYIVGKSDIPGYGIAVNPDNITFEDFKFVVGRAWDSNSDSGPKLINTVIGVHNGDYINILKRFEQRFEESEAKLQSLEVKINNLSQFLSVANKTAK